MVPSETTPHRVAVTQSVVPGGDTAKTYAVTRAGAFGLDAR